MRVIHVAPTSFGPDGVLGGGERYPLELARAVAREVECKLITFGDRDASWVDGRLRVRVMRPLLRLGGHPARPIAPGLPRAIGQADVVHVHHMRSTASVTAAIAARLLRIPTVVTDHGLKGSDWAGALPRLYDRFLLVSRYSAAELRAPPARTEVIYGGADPVRLRPDPAAARAGLLFVGRLTPHKGVDVLIRALPDGVPLTIAGSGGHDRAWPERDYPALLRGLAAQRSVKFVGAVTDEDLASLYRRSTALVLPSVERTCYGREVAVSELLGLVVLEAMASGTPVIASRVGGVPELVEDGVTGYLVPPGDDGALRARILEIVGDPGLAARMGAAARARLEAGFTWEAVARRCLAAYREITATRVGARRR